MHLKFLKNCNALLKFLGGIIKYMCGIFNLIGFFAFSTYSLPTIGTDEQEQG